MADLVKRLQMRAKSFHAVDAGNTATLLTEAADRLAALEAEAAERGRARLDAIVAWHGSHGTEWRRKDNQSSATMTRPEEYVPLRALIPEAPCDGWQPISSAPKDGTVVWVWCPSYGDLDSLTNLASWHEDAGWCVDELRTPTMWRSLQVPLPPSHDREGK